MKSITEGTQGAIIISMKITGNFIYQKLLVATRGAIILNANYVGNFVYQEICLKLCKEL